MAVAAEIHPRARVEAGYFAFRVKAVPDTPTHCRGRGCGVLLEPMRRYAGLCKACVARVARRAARRRTPRLRVVRSFVRHGEKHLELECSCGAHRVMRVATFNSQRPTRCRRCLLRETADARRAAREAHEAKKGTR